MHHRTRLVAALVLLTILSCACAMDVPLSGPTRTATIWPPAATATAKTRATQSAVRPTNTRVVSSAEAMRLLCTSTIMSTRSTQPGKVVRRQTPVLINAHNIPRVLQAIKDIEEKTDGAVTFKIVDADPPAGITLIEGDAVGSDGGPGCGNVTDKPDARAGNRNTAGAGGVLNTLAYVHLGSTGCDDARTGYQRHSVAAHEITHALGLISHFQGFTGDEGISAEVAAALKLLYGAPPGADMAALCSQ